MNKKRVYRTKNAVNISPRPTVFRNFALSPMGPAIELRTGIRSIQNLQKGKIRKLDVLVVYNHLNKTGEWPKSTPAWSGTIDLTLPVYKNSITLETTHSSIFLMASYE